MIIVPSQQRLLDQDAGAACYCIAYYMTCCCSRGSLLDRLIRLPAVHFAMPVGSDFCDVTSIASSRALMAEKVRDRDITRLDTEVKVKKTRASKPKVKTGCQTCKFVFAFLLFSFVAGNAASLARRKLEMYEST